MIIMLQKLLVPEAGDMEENLETIQDLYESVTDFRLQSGEGKGEGKE